MNQKIWIAIQQEQGGKRAAFVVEIGEGDNIVSKLAAYPNAFGNAFTTRKKAEEVARCWNDGFRQQGKHLWDIPNG